MGLFDNFPYTNFHELNLDWIIKRVKEAYGPDNPPENIVLSVNGETGDVTLYRNAIVRLPDVEDDMWNVYRNLDGQGNGIQFIKDGDPQIIQGLNRYYIFTEHNPPPYPVTSVNGQTGDVSVPVPVQSVNGQTGDVVLQFPVTSVNGQTGAVILQFPVTSVNGQTGNVVLYQAAVVRLPDSEATSWNIHRIIDGQSNGIEFTKDGAATIIQGTDRYPIYTVSNPPPYPVRSVNGKTGVINTPFTDPSAVMLVLDTSASGVTWGIKRNISGGTLALNLEKNNSDVPEVYAEYQASGSQTVTRKKLLTVDDIPSSTGVVSVNGKDGVVVLDSEDIPLDSGEVETVGDAIWQNRDNFAELYDEEETYSLGDYAIGQDGTLYRCNTAISTPEVFTPAHWTAVRVTDEISENSDDIQKNSDDVTDLMNGLAIIVDGDTVPAQIAVPDGGYAYIRNNTHGLADGLYINSSGSDFPYSGGTADSTVFTSVAGAEGGALNEIISILSDYTKYQDFTLSETRIRIYYNDISPVKLLTVNSNDGVVDLPDYITITNTKLRPRAIYNFYCTNTYAASATIFCQLAGTSLTFITKDNYPNGAIVYI